MKKITLIALIVLGMVSCSDDSVTPQEAEATLIGTWELITEIPECPNNRGTMSVSNDVIATTWPIYDDCDNNYTTMSSWELVGDHIRLDDEDILTWTIVSLSKNSLTMTIYGESFEFTYKRK